jgi:hypothetical protein
MVLSDTVFVNVAVPVGSSSRGQRPGPVTELGGTTARQGVSPLLNARSLPRKTKRSGPIALYALALPMQLR